MSPTLKRILLIVLLLAVSTLIGFGLYLFFRRPAAFIPGRQTGAPTGTPGQLPTAGQRTSTVSPGGADGGQQLPQSGSGFTSSPPGPYRPEPVVKISEAFVAYPSLGATGAMRYHNVGDGKFYRLLPDGTVRELSDQVFYGVKNVTWAKAKDKAVIEYPDGNKIVYNFEAQKQVTLPKHWEEFSFSPEANEIAAKSLALAPENRWIVVTKDDGTGTRLIEHLGNNADQVIMDWSPSRQTVAFSKTGQPQGADRREVLFVGLNQENFKSTVVEGLNFQPHWSPTGQKLLYSVDSERSDFKPELWIVDAYGDKIGANRQMLNLNTWAGKCTFADDTTVFCAVPRTLPTGAGMSPAIAANIPDDLYKIDLRTGLRTELPMGGLYTVNSVSFDQQKNRLLFTDNNKTGVFEVKL